MNLGAIGATAAGIRASDGIVLAAERRLAYGGYVLSKSAKKVVKINDRMAMAAAGLFADIQALSRIIAAEIRYRETLISTEMSVKAVAKLLSAIMYSYKYYPFISEVLLGGRDIEGFHLYVLDPVGSVIEDNYAAVGSGATIAIGIIESEYRPDIKIEEAEKIVVKAIRAAASRDVSSGDGIDVAIISASNVIEHFYSLM